ncbi:MAG: hypothetical protein ABI273_16150 [Lacunisphaera sp.]
MNSIAENPSPLPLYHVVGFSGHRQLTNVPGVTTAIRDALDSLRQDAPGEWIALSSAAAGADLLFIRSARGLKMGWEASLPLPLIDFQRDFPPQEWPEVKALIDQAEHLEVTMESGSREDSYLAGGLDIVNRCDVLLVVWDGQPARGKGGTADVVAYARAKGRPLLILNPETLATSRERFETLSFADARLHLLPSLPAADPTPPASVHAQLVIFQQQCERAADALPSLGRLNSIVLCLNIAGVAVATASLIFGWHSGGLPWATLLILVVALGIAAISRTSRSQPHLTRCRLAAEITRSALAIWGMPRTTRLFPDFEWSGLESLRRSLDVLQRRDARQNPVDFETFRKHYLSERIDRERQIFARQETQANRLLARLRMGFAISSVGAVAFAAIIAMNVSFGWAMSHPGLEISNYLSLTLPLLSAAFLALISIHHLPRQVASAREMVLRLDAAHQDITLCQSWAGLERAIAKAEQFVLRAAGEINGTALARSCTVDATCKSRG